MARVRLPLQIGLALFAAVLSLYLWLRAIGGEPGVAPLRSPLPLAKDRVVATFVAPRRLLRLHLVRPKHARAGPAAAGSRLAVSRARTVRLAPVATHSTIRSGGGSAAPASPAAPRQSPSSPPPPPPASPSHPSSPPPPPPPPPAQPSPPSTPKPKPTSPPPP